MQTAFQFVGQVASIMPERDSTMPERDRDGLSSSWKDACLVAVESKISTLHDEGLLQ